MVEEAPDPEVAGRLHDLEDIIYNHDATQMEFHLNSLWSAHYTLVRNYQEFRQTMNEYEETGADKHREHMNGENNRFKIPQKYTPEETTGYVFTRSSPDIDEEPFIFLREGIRRVNNYATSAYSLYENTQNFKNKWIDDEFQDRYYDKLDHLDAGPINDLVLDIRRYTTHYRGVPLALNQHWDETGTTHYHLTVPKNKLEEADCLKSSSEAYVDHMSSKGFYKDKIRVEWLIHRHKEAIDPFYNWLVDEMYKAYAVEFDELEELQKEANRLRQKL